MKNSMTHNLKGNSRRKGFIMPTVLVISLAVVIVMTALLSVNTSSYEGTYVDHYQKLSDEAAEAGTAYATACLNLSNHTQTWGPAASKGDLKPSSECDGDATFPGVKYVYSDSDVRTYFTVGNLDQITPFSAQISAKGYSEVLRPDGSISKTYQSIQKKVITWSTDLNVTMSASGTHRTCAVVSFQVYCWGYNAYGQLGNGQYIGSPYDIETASSVDSYVPVKVYQAPGVMAGKKIKKVFVAQHHSCALSDDGLMYCWGLNSNGQIGTGNLTLAPKPVQVGGALAGKTITDIGGTYNDSCAIADGKIYCWGANSRGTTGQNLNSGNTLSPTLVVAGNTSTTLPTNYTATALSTSGSRSRTMCAIVSGKAYCWGDNYSGAVGDGNMSGTTRLVPTKVDDTGLLSGKTVTAITAEGYLGDTVEGPHVCVIASGALYCWGDNTDGQLGNNSNTDTASPVAVSATGVLSGKSIQDVQAGIYHTCAMADNGAYCWGRNNYGQVGDGTNTSTNVPVAVATQPGILTSSNVVGIGGGANRGCAAVTDGRTFCWGYNNGGQIGDGTTINRNVPTESLFLRPIDNQYIF